MKPDPFNQSDQTVRPFVNLYTEEYGYKYFKYSDNGRITDFKFWVRQIPAPPNQLTINIYKKKKKKNLSYLIFFTDSHSFFSLHSLSLISHLSIFKIPLSFSQEFLQSSSPEAPPPVNLQQGHRNLISLIPSNLNLLLPLSFSFLFHSRRREIASSSTARSPPPRRGSRSSQT